VTAGEVAVIIPARYSSTRFPGKPLVRLKGADGRERSLIEWSWRAAAAAVGTAAVIVATDDARIVAEVEGFGGRAVLTPSDLRNGTERCAFHVASLRDKPQLIVNFQGDAPLVPPGDVRRLIDFAIDRESAMATPFVRCNAKMAAMLRTAASEGRAGGTCVVTDQTAHALYFSKYPIPFGATEPLKMHIGLYAYTPEALARYAALPPSGPELAEGLEQLRFLDAGIAIDMLELPLPETGLWELNNPEDVPVIERALSMHPAGEHSLF
jgi:3-deoxy-manno-octulosonate cytidylyltransferase (CMP-KDO synthetase)